MTEVQENNFIESPVVPVEENIETKSKRSSTLVMVGSIVAASVLAFTLVWFFRPVDSLETPYIDDRVPSLFESISENWDRMFLNEPVEEFDEDTLATHSHMVYPKPPGPGEEVDSSDEI